jgi:hypothetical protein
MIMISSAAFLADVSLPDPLAQNTAPATGLHLSPAFVALAIGALALVAYLLWDVLRQKREEKRQRNRLERFREKKFKEAQGPPV